MKVRRFNESKLDWSKDKIVNFIKERDDIYAKDQYIRRRIEEFLTYNKELLPKELQEYIKEFEDEDEGPDLFDVYKIKNQGDKLELRINWNDGDDGEEIYLTKEQVDDLVDYMNDIDLYKDANRYNV